MNTKKQSANRLGKLIRYYIAVEQTELRTVAAEVGISAATLMRISHGRSMDAETLVKIVNWMLEKQ